MNYLPEKDDPGQRPFLFLAVTLVILLLLELLAILLLNDGRFTYTLDDAYIHLALATRIGQGFYGINPGEAAAAASSILWPLLLTPMGGMAWGEFAPLVINSLVAVLTLHIYYRVVLEAFCPCPTRRVQFIAYGLVLLLIPLTNLVGLVYSGLEHVLQLWMTALLVWGLIQENQNGRILWWLPVVIVLGPLIRYENLALSIPALLYLVLRGRHRLTLISGTLLASLIMLFSWFLHSLGLDFFPGSIVAKSRVFWYGGRLEQIYTNASENLLSPEGLLFISVAVLLALVALSTKKPKAERLLSGTIILTLALHLLFGTMDGYHRYETYAWTAAVLSLIYLYREALRGLAGGRLSWPMLAALFWLAGLSASLYGTPIITSPLAANSLYRQQYQMHRFVRDYYQAPVAVVDLGRVAYQNDHYVLDLWGLASPEALSARRSGNDPAWMNELAQAHDVHLAMIYDFRFRTLPSSWLPLGRLVTGEGGSARDEVSFYALDEETVAEIIPLLDSFADSLPPGVAWQWTPGELNSGADF